MLSVPRGILIFKIFLSFFKEKFIRIHFSQNFGIAGADIESYLSEKSRITYCMEAERNYHIFYQLLSPAFPDIHSNICCLEIQRPTLSYFL